MAGVALAAGFAWAARVWLGRRACPAGPLVVERRPPEINSVSRLGSYYFHDFATHRIPEQIATLEALRTSAGMPGYLIQEWRRGHQRLLLVRAMPTGAAPGGAVSAEADAP